MVCHTFIKTKWTKLFMSQLMAYNVLSKGMSINYIKCRHNEAILYIYRVSKIKNDS